ncbi:hypothetical protein AJ79_09084 [Helicocarpus griseus UAMH5409]|uniref:Uncharacterized protein n=1 Tax=Helicocarpus griseus UAMH5409 TaxID=1447875 RepID=A0A2B7WMG3_9EURO|nr:hypothetical protein AJ79_09084 [Helicocarpus griseus UAMH5409]
MPHPQLSLAFKTNASVDADEREEGVKESIYKHNNSSHDSERLKRSPGQSLSFDSLLSPVGCLDANPAKENQAAARVLRAFRQARAKRPPAGALLMKWPSSNQLSRLLSA